jgi:hypothetical protein
MEEHWINQQALVQVLSFYLLEDFRFKKQELCSDEYSHEIHFYLMH